MKTFTAIKRSPVSENNPVVLTLPYELPDLNTYINTERTNKFMAAKLKKDYTEAIYFSCLAAKLPKLMKPIIVTITWFCKNKKKDPDNIAFAKKFILDGMRDAGVIVNDGWGHIVGFRDNFAVDVTNPCVVVSLEVAEDYEGY